MNLSLLQLLNVDYVLSTYTRTSLLALVIHVDVCRCLLGLFFLFNLLFLSFLFLLVQHVHDSIHAALRTHISHMLRFQQFPDSGAFGCCFAHAAVLPVSELLQSLVCHIHDAAGFNEVAEQAVGFSTPAENDGTADLGGQVGIQQVNRVLEDLHLLEVLIVRTFIY